MSDVVIAFDPGNIHVGVCTFVDGVYCTAWEVRPDQVANVIDLAKPDTIVLETFRLYPSKFQPQSFSDMQTPQLIGEIKAIAKAKKIPIVMQAAALRKVAEKSPWVRRHLKDIGKPKSKHAYDAVLHNFYYRYFNSRNPNNQRGK